MRNCLIDKVQYEGNSIKKFDIDNLYSTLDNTDWNSLKSDNINPFPLNTARIANPCLTLKVAGIVFSALPLKTAVSDLWAPIDKGPNNPLILQLF